MPDTFSNVLALRLQETGGNDGTWGTKLNDEVFQYIEDVLTGVTSISTTGGDTTLTASQRRCNMIRVSGTLASNAVLIVPNKTQNWLVWNETAFDQFAVTIKTASGVDEQIATIPPGCVREVYCDGADGVWRTDFEQIGSLITILNAISDPAGVVSAVNGGVAVSRTGVYRDIFRLYGTAYGPGDGATTFNLPFLASEPVPGTFTYIRL